MFKKSLMLSSFMLCTVNAHAGFFGGGDDFKCGREDAVKALQESIRSEAAGRLQSDYITNPSIFYGKNLQDFQDKLNTIEINASNVSTSGGSGHDLSCKATISIKLPVETLDVVKDVPEYLSGLVVNSGALNSNSIVWNNYSYDVKLADNKKDIAVMSISYIASAMLQAIVLAVTKAEVINDNYIAKVNDARNSYSSQDAYLNDVWKSLPDSARSAMKKEQMAWVNEKVVRCGKLSDANSTAIPARKRVGIYQCQTKITQERISFLGGDRDD